MKKTGELSSQEGEILKNIEPLAEAVHSEFSELLPEKSNSELESENYLKDRVDNIVTTILMDSQFNDESEEVIDSSEMSTDSAHESVETVTDLVVIKKSGGFWRGASSAVRKAIAFLLFGVAAAGSAVQAQGAPPKEPPAYSDPLLKKFKQQNKAKKLEEKKVPRSPEVKEKVILTDANEKLVATLVDSFEMYESSKKNELARVIAKPYIEELVRGKQQRDEEFIKKHQAMRLEIIDRAEKWHEVFLEEKKSLPNPIWREREKELLTEKKIMESAAVDRLVKHRKDYVDSEKDYLNKVVRSAMSVVHAQVENTYRSLPRE